MRNVLPPPLHLLSSRDEREMVPRAIGAPVAFQPEVLYSQEGAKARFTNGAVSLDGTIKIDYLRVSPLLRFGRSGKSGVYAVVGPVFGSLMRAKDELAGLPAFDFKDELRGFDVSLVAGVGVNLSRFLVEGRFMAGLRDMNKVKRAAGIANKGSTFTLLAGVHF